MTPLPLHVYTDHGRFYQVGEHKYPGVGTILNATDTTYQQRFWKQWRENPENAAHSEQSRNRGKLFHAIAENHFKPSNYRTDSLEDEAAIAEVEPFWQSIQDVLPRISDIRLLESATWHQIGHYASTVDMVASFDGIPCILDWKTASKKKYIKYCERYPLQLTAYCACINRMYGIRIKTGIIVVALPNAEAQVFQFSLKDYWLPWLNRLMSYWQQQTTPLAAHALGVIRGEYGHNNLTVQHGTLNSDNCATNCAAERDNSSQKLSSPPQGEPRQSQKQTAKPSRSVKK